VGGDRVAGGGQRVLEPQAVEDEGVDLIDLAQLAGDLLQLAELATNVIVELEGDLDPRGCLRADLLGVLLAQEGRRVEELVLGAARGQQGREEEWAAKALPSHGTANIAGTVPWPEKAGAGAPQTAQSLAPPRPGGRPHGGRRSAGTPVSSRIWISAVQPAGSAARTAVARSSTARANCLKRNSLHPAVRSPPVNGTPLA